MQKYRVPVIIFNTFVRQNLAGVPGFFSNVLILITIIVIHNSDRKIDAYRKAELDHLKEQEELSRSLFEQTAKALVTAIDAKDAYTNGHSSRVADYAREISKIYGYSPQQQDEIYMMGLLHDVGKIGISDAIINKPGKLTAEEFEIMKTHTSAGEKIMEKAISTVEGENYLKEARNMAAYHHERWDGKGYPEGLHGEVIPLSARITSVADVFDALTSTRVYKPAFPLEEALALIQEGSGTQFDPKCVEVFMESLPEVKVILRKYNESV